MAYFPPKIIVSGRLLSFYEQFDEYRKAINTAKYYQKKCKARYFILKRPGMFGIAFGLYLTKVYRPW